MGGLLRSTVPLMTPARSRTAAFSRTTAVLFEVGLHACILHVYDAKRPLSLHHRHTYTLSLPHPWFR